MFKKLLFVLLALTLAVWAAEVQGSLVVEILRADNDAPIKGVKVTVQDRLNLRGPVEGVTDDAGKARFDNLPLGEYYVDAAHPEFGGDRALVRVNPGVETAYKTMLDPAGQERVIKVREQRLLVNTKDPSEGAVTRRERPFLDRQVADSNTVQGVLTTVPGVQRDALGQVHARGEHKSVTYSLDGIQVPIPSSNMISQPLDPEFLEALDVQTGAFDPSNGGQLGVLINALTPITKEPFVLFRPKFGNLGQYEALLKAGGSNDDGSFGYFVGAKTMGSDVYLEAPTSDQQTLNNRGRNTSLLVRLQGKTDDDQVGFNIAYQNALYGIPQTPQNYAAGVRQEEQDTNLMALLSWKHKLSDDDDLLMGISVLRTSQALRNNGVFTPYSIFPEDRSEELAHEGFPLDPTNPGSPYLPTSDLVITQVQPTINYTHRLGEGEKFSAGLTADFIRSRQSVFINDLGGGRRIPLPGDSELGAQQLNANVGRNGFFGGAYLSHTVKLADWCTVNYGLRADTFDNGLNVNTSQLSPLANFSFALTDKQAIRLSYNRIFQPPPLELDASGNTFVLPQRVSAYELSYENQFDSGITGKVALVRKDYRDQVDIALLVGNSNFPLFAPVNFGTAYYQGLELSLNTHYKTGWNGFLAATVSEARPLTPGPFSHELPEYNDHDQRVQATWGFSHTWENGFSAATDFFYGSGYPQIALGLYNAAGISPYGLGPDRVPRFFQNLTLNYFPLEQSGDFEVGGGLQVLNLWDARPLLNFFSEFSGTRFSTQRRVMLNATLKW